MAITVGSSLKKANRSVPYTVDDYELKGGFRCVTSIEERDAIPIGGRRGGMIVRVVEGDEVTDYTLPGNNISNMAWKIEERAATGDGGGGGEPDVPPEGDWVATSGGQMSGPFMLTETGRINFNEKALLSVIGNDVVYQNKQIGSLLVFHNGVEPTIEIDTDTGQITALLEVALVSDKTLKKEIYTIENSLELTDQLRGVFFEWVQGGKSMGVIAQELQKVFPFLVYTGSDGRLAVRYTALIGLLIENDKALNTQLKELDERFYQQENAIDKLTKLVEQQALAIQNLQNPKS